MTKDLHTCQFVRRVSSSIIFIIFLIILCFFTGQAESQTLKKTGISILVPNYNSQYMRVANTIQKSLKKNKNNETVNIITLSNLRRSRSINLDNKKLVVLIGSKSFDYYLKSKAKSPYITSLITRSAFNYLFARTKNKNGFIGGVSVDQPSRRFVSLAKMLVPNLKKIALVSGPEGNRKKKTILKGLNKYNLNYNFVEILLNDDPVKKLRKAYESNQALIIFPDKKKFNSSLSRWILTLSYQYKIPVISYSKKYAKAGALASLFSTPAQIGDQTAEMINSFLQNFNNKPKKLVDPKYFDIQINKSVVSALNLTVPSRLELLRKIPN